MATAPRLSLNQAAIHIGRKRSHVRQLIEAGLLKAYRVGGSEETPWLEVEAAELDRVYAEASVYVPKAKRQPRRRRDSTCPSTLDPVASRV